MVSVAKLEVGDELEYPWKVDEKIWKEPQGKYCFVIINELNGEKRYLGYDSVRNILMGKTTISKVYYNKVKGRYYHRNRWGKK